MGQALSDPSNIPPAVVQTRRRAVAATEVNGHERSVRENDHSVSRSQSAESSKCSDSYLAYDTAHETSLSHPCITPSLDQQQVNGFTSKELSFRVIGKPIQHKSLDDSSSFDNRSDAEHSLTASDNFFSTSYPIISDLDDNCVLTSQIRSSSDVCNNIDSFTNHIPKQLFTVPQTKHPNETENVNIDYSLKTLDAILALKNNNVSTSNSELSAEDNTEQEKKMKTKQTAKKEVQEGEKTFQLSKLGKELRDIPIRNIDTLNANDTSAVIELNNIENKCIELYQPEITSVESKTSNMLGSDKGPLNEINLLKLDLGECLLTNSEKQLLSSLQILRHDETSLNNGLLHIPASDLDVDRLCAQVSECSKETLKVPGDDKLNKVSKKVDESCNSPVSCSAIATASDIFCSSGSSHYSGKQDVQAANSFEKAITATCSVNDFFDSKKNECLRNLAPEQMPTLQPGTSSKLLTINNHVCNKSTDLIASEIRETFFSNSKANGKKRSKEAETVKSCYGVNESEVSRSFQMDQRPQQMFLNAILPNVTNPKESANKTSQSIQNTGKKTAGLFGSYEACVVQCFPKSRVATFNLGGQTTRAYFFLSDVKNSEDLPLNSVVILDNLTHMPKSQATKIYRSTIQAHLVTVPKESREEVNGRTGAIVSFLNSETGVLELTMGKEKLLGSFSKGQVSGMDFKGQTLKESWPVGTMVHFCGEIVMKLNKKEFIVSKVWPQGGQNMKSISELSSKSVNLEKITKATATLKVTQLENKVEEKIIRKEFLRALSGNVTEYLANGNGVVKFRVQELYLESQFNASLCSDPVPGKSLSELWPPSTQVHFHGKLTTYQYNSKFEITCIWSKRLPTLLVSKLPAQTKVYEGEVIELRFPAAFVVSTVVSGKIVNVFVLTKDFRVSRNESQLQQLVPVQNVVQKGLRISLRLKPAVSGKDCEFVATDAWPSEAVKFGPNTEVTRNPSEAKVGSKHLGLAISTPKTPLPLSIPVHQPIKYAQNTVENSGTLPCNKSKSTFKTPTVSKLPTNSTSSDQSGKATAASAKDPIGPGGSVVSGGSGAWTTKVGMARRGRVVRVSPDVALLRVQTTARPGSDANAAPMVAALARHVHLCGVSLENMDLTTLLAKGQELEVHLLPSDEKRLSKFDGSFAAKATPSLQNTELVSAMWLGRAHFESSSLQFAELTNYCQVHKIPDTVRHTLTSRLGQLLGEDGRKAIKPSSDEEMEAVEGGYKNKSENIKLTSHLAVTADEPMVLAELKDMGPEKFLCAQLKQLMHSVLKESVRSAQEFFLSSLRENCGGTELYNTLATQTPALVDAALREFLHEKLLQEGVTDNHASTSNVPASVPCVMNASAESTTAAVAGAISSTSTSAPPTIKPLPKAIATGPSGQSTAASVSTASLSHTGATPSVTAEDAADGVLGDENVRTVVEGKDVETNSEQLTAAGSPDATCLLLRGVQEVLQQAKKGLKASSDVPLCAMQEPVRKHSKIEVTDQLAEGSVVPETSKEQKSEQSEVTPALDAFDTGEPDKRDFQKTLCAELQKHAKEVAIFRDEACSLIENWKSQDSPAATPEELEFLQELSLLLDNKVEDNGKSGKNEEDTSLVAQQLIKFWNTANFPLTPVAQRGLQRLQELFGAPNKNMQGNEKECLGSGGDGLVEVEAALKEVREAFRDVKHVFEVQRCFRDLRECFRDVRRAYKGREPRPRALPPCADAPACAAAAAAAAHALADSVGPVPMQQEEEPQDAVPPPDKPPADAPPSDAPLMPAPEVPAPTATAGDNAEAGAGKCVETGTGADAGVELGATGKPTPAPEAPASKDCPSAQSHENSKVEVSSKSCQTITSIDTAPISPSSTNTSERGAQTISTGAVLALHWLPDE